MQMRVPAPVRQLLHYCSFQCMCVLSHSAISDSATPRTVARQAPLSRDFPGKSTREGCHFLLQGIFLTQELNPRLLHWHADFLPLSHLGSPFKVLHCKIRSVFFIFCICFYVCIISVKSILNLLQYSTIQLTVLAEYLGSRTSMLLRM